MAKPEHKIFVNKSLAIIDQINTIMDRKGWSQKRLATELGKHESEISKWFSGMHNFTLETISKVEAALDHEIILTDMKAREKYFLFNEPHNFISYKVKRHYAVSAGLLESSYAMVASLSNLMERPSGIKGERSRYSALQEI